MSMEINSDKEKQRNIFKDTTNHVFENYFKFSGRTPRRYFWIYQLLSYGVLAVGTILFLILVFFEFNDFAVLFAQIYLVIWILGIIPIELGIRIRRLHDIGLSGWTLLISFIPIANFFFTIYYCFAPSESAENKYGEVVI